MVDNDEYLQLKRDSLFLTCLLSAGVDNWEGYEEARELFNEQEE